MINILRYTFSPQNCNFIRVIRLPSIFQHRRYYLSDMCNVSISHGGMTSYMRDSGNFSFYDHINERSLLITDQ